MTDRIRVLHVDDESETRALTAEGLEQADDRIDVTPVGTQKQALERLSEARIDCVLTGYSMPGMDGLDFLSAVRDRWPDLPFILYTEKGSEEVASDAISGGVTDYVRKASAREDYDYLAQRIVAATERKRAIEYERIADLVREIQSDLVRARTREEIETGVCEKLVGADPYVFAWIGTVDAVHNRVKPRASAGLEEGYLDTIDITIDDRATGQGPTGKALGTRSTQVIQDIAEEPSYDPWREEALERGYRSSAAIPVEYNGTLYGILNVYADHPMAFDADERGLLEDLSETVAHAYYRIQVQEQYEAQYRDLFEDAPMMMAFTREKDGEPIVEDCNQRFADKLGYSPVNLRGRPLAELYTDASAERLLDDGGYQRALEGEFSPREREFVTADGERLIALLQATPRRDDDGEIIGTHALYVDITDRKRARSVLGQAEAMEASVDGIAILDEDDEFVYLNQAFADIFRYDDPDTLTGETWSLLEAGEETERYDEEIGSALEQTGEWRGETKALRADGTTFPQELSLTRLGDGSLVAVVRDITDRKEREKELRELTREFESVFENVQDALFLLDVDEEGTIRFRRFNEREEEFTGKSTEEIRGKTPIEVFGREVGAQLEANYRECLERQETITYEEELPIGGETTAWQTKLTPIVLDGQIERIVGSGREITQLRERERELKRKNDLFEQAQEIAEFGAWETDLQTNEGWWSGQVNRIYGLPPGYEPDPGEGMEYFHPEDRSTIREAYERAIEEGESYDLELRVVDANGTTKWVRTHGVPHHEDGEVVRIRGTMQDITERKNRERQIAQLKERLELAVEGGELGVWDWDMTTDEVEFNEQWARILGHSLDEIEFHLDAWEKRVHPDDLEAVQEELDAHIAGEVDYYETEHRMRTADGDWKWVRDVGKIFERDENGDPLRAVGIHIDITERKEHDREIERQEKKYRNLFEESRDALMLLDREGFFDCNEATLELFGLDSIEEIKNYTPSELSPPTQPDGSDSEAGAKEHIKRAFEEGEDSFEWTHTTADGDPFLAEVKLSRFEMDDQPALHALVRDITDRKEREQKLKQFREAVERTAHMVYITDTDGTIEYVNPAFEEVTGFAESEALGQDPSILKSGEYGKEYYEEFWETILSGDQWKAEMHDERANGEDIVLNQTVSPITDEDGDPQKFVAVGQDITQRKEYERKLEQQRDNLEVLNQVVRHDIRNDMTVVRGRANLLEEHVEKAGQDDLEAVQKATENAIELTKTARDLSEIMLSTEEDIEPVGLERNLDPLIENARSTFDTAVITVEDRIPDVRVYGNDLIEAVFRNLIQNAVVHNDKESPEIHISTTLEEGTVTVAIADNGPGIPDDQKETIFGKGEKGLDSPGTGLGLYLVERLVEQYGGDVWVEDRTGWGNGGSRPQDEDTDADGSVFYVELPTVI